MGFSNSLFNGIKLINNKNNIEKNISEELLTFRTLVITAPFRNEAEEMGQLVKILSACRLQPTDYGIVPGGQHEWSYYRSQENIQEVLLFGVTENMMNIGISLPENQPVSFDGKIWIKTAAVSEIINSQQIKNNLWQNALKPHFAA